MAWANSATPIGAELPSVSMAMSPERFKRWYGGSSYAGAVRNIHIDPEAARSEGLPAPIAGGADIINLSLRALLMFFGEGWVVGGRASFTVVRPTLWSDFMTAKGRVVDRVEFHDRIELECEVWVEDQAQTKKIVGRATGRV